MMMPSEGHNPQREQRCKMCLHAGQESRQEQVIFESDSAML